MTERVRVRSHRELDQLVAQKFFGEGSPPFKYSSSVFRAFQLVLHLIRLGWYIQIAFLPDMGNKWTCKFLHFQQSRVCIGLNSSPEVAICLAALKVMGVEVVLHLN